MKDHRLEQLFADYVSEGNLGALGEVFDRVAPDLERLARRLTRDRSQAQDLVQETFLAALECSNTFEQGRALRPWLLGILVHRARKEQRLMNRQEGEPIQWDSTPPERFLETRELEEAVRRAVHELPDSLRSALVGSLLEGKGNRELAGELAISNGTLRVRLHRGLERIRLLLPSSLATVFALLFIHSRGIAQVRSRVLQEALSCAGHSGSMTGATTNGLTALMTSKALITICGAFILSLLALLGARWMWTGTVQPPTTLEVAATEPPSLEPPSEELRAPDLEADPAIGVRQALATSQEAQVMVRGEGWAQLEITVTGRATGSPVVGLLLGVEELPSIEEELLLRESRVETDARGYASVGIATELPLVLVLSASGWTSGALRRVQLDPFTEGETRQIAVQVEGERQGGYWVRVVSDEDEGAIPQAKIVEVDPFGSFLQTARWVYESSWIKSDPLAETDAYGLVRMPSGFASQRRFAVLAEGFAPGFFDEEKSGAESAHGAYEVRLARPAQVEVLVLGEGGLPETSVQVRLDFGFGELMRNTGSELLMSLGRHSVVQNTDEVGRARFSKLPCGTAFMVATSSPESGQAWQVDLASNTALSSGEQRVLTIHSSPSTDIYGVAFDQDGAVAQGAMLILLRDDQEWGGYLGFNASGSAVQSATVDENGEFAFMAVPAGRWLVAPKALRDHNAHLSGRKEPDLVDLFAPTPHRFVVGGKGPVRELSLDLWRDLYLRGKVEDEEGRGTAEALVFARSLGGSFLQVQRTLADGSFVLGPLPKGSLHVSAMSYLLNSRSRDQVAAPGETEVSLRLTANGSIRFVTTDASTGAGLVCEFNSWRTDAGTAMAQRKQNEPLSSACELDGFSPGTWTSIVTAQGDLVAIRGGITVRPNEAAGPVRVALHPGGRLKVARPASGLADFRQIRIFQGGTLVGSMNLAPGKDAELLLPIGGIEVIEFDASGQALPSVALELSLDQGLEFQASQ